MRERSDGGTYRVLGYLRGRSARTAQLLLHMRRLPLDRFGSLRRHLLRQGANLLCLMARMAFDRLGHVSARGDRELADLLGLRYERLELLAPIGALQLDDLGEVLGARQALREIEAGIHVALGDVYDFAIQRRGGLSRGIVRALDSLDARIERGLGILVSLARLCHRRAGEGTHGLWDGGVECHALELRKGIEGVGLLVVGGSIGIEGHGHVSTLLVPARMWGCRMLGLQARDRKGR